MRFALLLAACLCSAQVRPVAPKSGPAPIGPYSPGILAGDYLYVSGQGAKRPDGTMPSAFEEQVRQTLDNVKAIVEAADLTMEHVVYSHVYLEDISKFDAMNRVFAEYFPKTPPARAVLGVAKLPGTPVESAQRVALVRMSAAVEKGAATLRPLSGGNARCASLRRRQACQKAQRRLNRARQTCQRVLRALLRLLHHGRKSRASKHIEEVPKSRPPRNSRRIAGFARKPQWRRQKASLGVSLSARQDPDSAPGEGRINSGKGNSGHTATFSLGAPLRLPNGVRLPTRPGIERAGAGAAGVD